MSDLLRKLRTRLIGLLVGRTFSVVANCDILGNVWIHEQGFIIRNRLESPDGTKVFIVNRDVLK